MPRFFRNRPASRVLPLRPGAGGAVRLAPPAGRSVLAPGRAFLSGRSSRRGLSSAPMSEVTRVLSAIERGDPHAAGQLLPLVYDELRRLAAGKVAREAAGHSLQATALVHEASLRLVGAAEPRVYRDRRHFFAAAASA